MRKHSSKLAVSAFSLLELMTVVVVICILATMSIGAFTSLQGKADRGNCQHNLKNLFTAAAAYVTDHGNWPQVSVTDIQDPEYPIAWVEALKNYRITSLNWICPTTQRLLGNMDYNKFPRIDYFATPFDTTPRAPFLYPTHPWFLERGDVHGDGNLTILANGRIQSLNEFVREARSGTTSPP